MNTKKVSNTPNIEVFVATHKKFDMPTNDSIYKPILGGSKLNPQSKLEYLSDAIGENISEKKMWYNELTSLFWAWKNSTADIKGLCHYRRFFFDSYFSVNKKHILTRKQIIEDLESHDIILPVPYRYSESTVKEAFSISGKADNFTLLVAEKVIKDMYPDYAEAFDNVMKRNEISLCNSFIARRKIFDTYAQWLFSILFQCEPLLDLENREGQRQRIMGFLGERLLDVWVEKNQLRIRYRMLNNVEQKKDIKYYVKVIFEKFGIRLVGKHIKDCSKL